MLDKVSEYLAAGVPHVWTVEPIFQTVTVYQPGARPKLYNVDQEVSAEPDLPGLRVAVKELFQ